jgi:hypothetical protein
MALDRGALRVELSSASSSGNDRWWRRAIVVMELGIFGGCRSDGGNASTGNHLSAIEGAARAARRSVRKRFLCLRWSESAPASQFRPRSRDIARCLKRLRQRDRRMRAARFRAEWQTIPRKVAIVFLPSSPGRTIVSRHSATECRAVSEPISGCAVAAIW